jgi:hypothetical protein
MIEHSLQQSEPVALASRPFGRVVASILGCAALLAFMLITPLVAFVPTALFYCAIRNGRIGAWIALVVSVSLAAVAIVPGSLASPEAKFNLGAFAVVILGVALPSMAALPMVERGRPFGRVLAFLTGGAVIGLVATEYAMRALMNFSLQAYAAEAQKAGLQLMRMWGLPPPGPRAMHWNQVILPAQMLAYAILIFVLSLLMLGRLKAWREHAAGRVEVATAYLFRNLSLPEWLLFLFIAGGLTPLMSGLAQNIAANVLAVVTYLYVLQGLAIFRSVLLAANAGFAGTMLGWTLLAFLTFTGVGPLLLGLAGLFDPFFDFRHFKRKDDSHESHTD